MKSHHAAVFYSVVVVLAGCAVMRIEPVPITGPQSRMVFLGYSVLPRAGENWFLTETGESRLAFSKTISGGHTLTATVTAAPLFMNFGSPEDFVAWAKQTKERERAVPNRSKIIEHQENLDRSLNAVCSKYEMKAEDTPERGSSDSTKIMVESNGYSCMHPSAPSLFINIDFSERYDPVKDTPIGKTEGELFVKTFIFRSMEQDVLGRWVHQ